MKVEDEPEAPTASLGRKGGRKGGREGGEGVLDQEMAAGGRERENIVP